MEGTFEPTGIKSSTAGDVTYNSTSNRLRVTFRNTALYEYDGVTSDEVEAVKSSETQGKDLQKLMKAKPYRRVMD